MLHLPITPQLISTQENIVEGFVVPVEDQDPGDQRNTQRNDESKNPSVDVPARSVVKKRLEEEDASPSPDDENQEPTARWSTATSASVWHLISCPRSPGLLTRNRMRGSPTPTIGKNPDHAPGGWLCAPFQVTAAPPNSRQLSPLGVMNGL